MNPEIKIHCFEPSRSTHRQLVARAFSVVCDPQSLWVEFSPRHEDIVRFRGGRSEKPLHLREGLEDGHGLAPRAQTEMIRVETLDRCCEERSIQIIDYLKLDIEGPELEVCKGAFEMLQAGQIKVVRCEYGGCNIDARVLLKDLFTLFHQVGYTLYKIYSECPRRSDRYDQRLENFQCQNWVAMKNGPEGFVA